MDLNLISHLFSRALFLTFVKKKLIFAFCVLALSGLLVVFFRGLAWHAGHWAQLSLTFLPIFLCGGILLSMGILLIRIYHNEVKKKTISYRQVFGQSWQEILGASYFAIPIILTYLMLWVLLGVFVLLSEIPAMGQFFSVILSFAPFLINLGALFLCLVSLLMLFFVTPIIALKGMDHGLVFQVAAKRMEKEPLINIVLVLIALLPLLFILGMLILSAILTESITIEYQTLSHIVLKWFFIMLPFTAVLTPAVVFFFNFAAEAHVLMQKLTRE